MLTFEEIPASGVSRANQIAETFLAALSKPVNNMEEQRGFFLDAWNALIPSSPPAPNPKPIAISRPDGSALSCLLYSPAYPAEMGLLYLHGGGLMTLSAEAYDAQSRMLSNLLNAVILVPDFRLAPEHPFPAAYDDAIGAYAWMQSNADALNAPADRLCIMGDSGGGLLAACVAQDAKQASIHQPAAQVLLYPMLDLASMAPSRFDRGDWITHEGLHLTGQLYAPDALLDPRASPLRAPDFSGLAPALIITTDLDPVEDEARAYGLRLAKAEIACTHMRFLGETHGFLSFGDQAAVQAWDRIALWIKSTLSRGQK